jgi:hypothetical protein
MASDLDVIVTHALDLRLGDGTSSPVVVRMGRPRQDSDDYRCDYQIEGLSKPRNSYACGVDELQALSLALMKAGVDLRTSEEGMSGRLTRFGTPDLGSPPVEQATRPEWRAFMVDGEEFHWRRCRFWQRTADDTFVRCWMLEDAELGVGTAYPKDAEVGVEEARALVRLCKEREMPLL